MKLSNRMAWAAAGALFALSLPMAWAGNGLDSFGPAQGQASGGGSGDLTAVTVSGTGLSVTSGTGPIPDLSLDADLQTIAGLTCTRGDLIVGNSTPAWSRLSAGASSTVLAGGTDPAYTGSPTLSGTVTAAGVVAGTDLPSTSALIRAASSSADYLVDLMEAHTTAATGPGVQLKRARGNLGTPAIVQADDVLGSLTWYGYDASGSGDSLVACAQIKALVDGTPGSGDMPGRISLLTRDDGGSGVLTERVRIDNSGVTNAYYGIAQTNSTSLTGAGTVAQEGYLSHVYTYTGGSGAATTLTASQSGSTISNEGATVQAYVTLPTAAAGLRFRFVLQDADGIHVTANTGDTIRVLSLTSASAGYVESTTIGSVIELQAINATEWVTVSAVGTWSVDS